MGAEYFAYYEPLSLFKLAERRSVAVLMFFIFIIEKVRWVETLRVDAEKWSGRSKKGGDMWVKYLSAT